MDDMKPTMQLRWTPKLVISQDVPVFEAVSGRWLVLQQYWQNDEDGEWRDIEVEV